jgi:chromosome segregation ATPase
MNQEHASYDVEIKNLKDRISERTYIIAKLDGYISDLDVQIRILEPKLNKARKVAAVYSEARASVSGQQAELEQLNADRQALSERRSISVGIKAAHQETLDELLKRPEVKRFLELKAVGAI